MLLSVVICTRNRADLATASVQSVCNQTLPADRYEILLVDNGSTDHTHAAIMDVQRRYPKHVIRYVREEETGLSHARNRGYKEAAGIYVAYLDDDGKAPDHWLHLACAIIQEQQPAGLGGPIVPFYQAEKPAWFRDAYGTVHKTDRARPLGTGEFLNGGNMIWRKDLLVALNGFDTGFGMRGATIGYGEETELQLRLRKQNPQVLIYYDPALFAYHLVRPEKWSWTWLTQSRFAGGRQHYFAVPNQGFRQVSVLTTLLRIVARCALVVWELSFGVLLRKRDKYPFRQNLWYERTLSHVASLGAYYQHLWSRLNG